jgi:hypothetical protein
MHISISNSTNSHNFAKKIFKSETCIEKIKPLFENFPCTRYINKFVFKNTTKIISR